MKRLLLTLLVLLNLSAHAQWTIAYNKPDELKGTSSFYTNIFSTEDGDAISFRSDNDIILISSKNGQFAADNNKIHVLIGLYVKGEIVKKIEYDYPTSAKTTPNLGIRNTYLKPTRSMILKHLRCNGDVRIVVSRLHSADFDVTIPKNSDIKYSISIPDKTKNINGHEYLDLGLPSGTLWASNNVGAEHFFDNGEYYYFGDTMMNKTKYVAPTFREKKMAWIYIQNTTPKMV